MEDKSGLATIEARHPWTSSLKKTVATAPKGASNASSQLWTVQIPATVEVSALDGCSWTRHDGGVWTTSIDGKSYVLEPVTSSSPSYVVDDDNMLPIKTSMVLRAAIEQSQLDDDVREQVKKEAAAKSPKKKKKKEK